MPTSSPKKKTAPPGAQPGLSRDDFKKLCVNGFGDGHNSYAHAVAWFKDRLYVGTTRSNFQMMKIQSIFNDLPIHMWPVEGPNDEDGLYDQLDRRAQIWCYDPVAGTWEEIQRAPMVMGTKGALVARETGLRTMVVFQGSSDPEPALYVATWATSRAPGALLLRSLDGRQFLPSSPVGIIEGLPVTATRLLVPFKGKLFTSPTGTRGHNVKFAINVSGMPIIFATDDPVSGQWYQVCEPGLGDPDNQGVFAMAVFNDQLYAGTVNNKGFQVWRSDCEGEAPYRWTQVIRDGGGRGGLNQIAITMKVFNGALYVGTAIQNGGHDRTNQIGPAGSELIRIHPDDSWDLIVGNSRDTPDGRKLALSGIPPGFGNIFNGYFWSMEVHDGWLYLGTQDSTLWIRYLKHEAYGETVRSVLSGVGVERVIEHEAGCDLWRSADGENWIPVTRNGFGNPYNLGIRCMVSTPHGLFVSTANPFGPRAAINRDGVWGYEDNPQGGAEVWLGSK